MKSRPAIWGSRQHPPLVMIPVNDNHLGARNIMIPTEYKPQWESAKWHSKRKIHEQKTVYEPFNKGKPTPLHPPYMSYTKLTKNDTGVIPSDLFEGKTATAVSFPVIF